MTFEHLSTYLTYATGSYVELYYDIHTSSITARIGQNFVHSFSSALDFSKRHTFMQCVNDVIEMYAIWIGVRSVVWC